MKKFAFSLEKMLGYKNSILDREKGNLLEVRTRKNAMDERIENTIAQMQEMEREKCEKAARGTNVFELQAYSYQMENARQLVKQLRVEQERLQQEVERQLAVVVQLNQEVNGLEKLREKQLEEYNQQSAKEQELTIAEMISSKYIQQQAVQIS